MLPWRCFRRLLNTAQVASEGVKSAGKGKKGGAKAATNTVSRQNSVTHNSRHLKAIAKVCSKIGRRDLQACHLFYHRNSLVPQLTRWYRPTPWHATPRYTLLF